MGVMCQFGSWSDQLLSRNIEMYPIPVSVCVPFYAHMMTRGICCFHFTLTLGVTDTDNGNSVTRGACNAFPMNINSKSLLINAWNLCVHIFLCLSVPGIACQNTAMFTSLASLGYMHDQLDSLWLKSWHVHTGAITQLITAKIMHAINAFTSEVNGSTLKFVPETTADSLLS